MNGHGVGRLPRRVVWAYGLPALPAAVLGLPLLVYLPNFYAETLGLGFASVGAVLLFTRLCDVATDPLIGHLSDRTRTRLGRRRPWLIASLPVTLVAVWFLFLPPQDAGIVHLLAALYGLLPIAFKIAAIATMRTYTLDAAAQAGLRARIAGRGCPPRPPESRSAA